MVIIKCHDPYAINPNDGHYEPITEPKHTTKSAISLHHPPIKKSTSKPKKEKKVKPSIKNWQCVIRAVLLRAVCHAVPLAFQYAHHAVLHCTCHVVVHVYRQHHRVMAVIPDVPFTRRAERDTAFAADLCWFQIDMNLSVYFCRWFKLNSNSNILFF